MINILFGIYLKLEAENIKSICILFLKKLFQYYNSNYTDGEKMLNLYVIPNISPAAYKSYLTNGFKNIKEKNFKELKIIMFLKLFYEKI